MDDSQPVRLGHRRQGPGSEESRKVLWTLGQDPLRLSGEQEGHRDSVYRRVTRVGEGGMGRRERAGASDSGR